MSKKALLMILDGWGIGDQGKDDVIFNTPTPYWDSLLATYPHSQLQANKVEKVFILWGLPPMVACIALSIIFLSSVIIPKSTGLRIHLSIALWMDVIQIRKVEKA